MKQNDMKQNDMKNYMIETMHWHKILALRRICFSNEINETIN